MDSEVTHGSGSPVSNTLGVVELLCGDKRALFGSGASRLIGELLAAESVLSADRVVGWEVEEL